jgi:hypothetical protein
LEVPTDADGPEPALSGLRARNQAPQHQRSSGRSRVMHYKIRKLKTVGLRQGAPAAVSLEWCPPALRNTAIAIAGFAVLILGAAFIFLRAPAVLVIPLGLAILAREFTWANKALDWPREHVRRSWIAVRDRLAKVP